MELALPKGSAVFRSTNGQFVVITDPQADGIYVSEGGKTYTQCRVTRVVKGETDVEYTGECVDPHRSEVPIEFTRNKLDLCFNDINYRQVFGLSKIEFEPVQTSA